MNYDAKFAINIIHHSADNWCKQGATNGLDVVKNCIIEQNVFYF